MQHNFTVDGIQKVNEKIVSDLEVIKNSLTQSILNIHSLVLVGGFARGEGSVLLENGIPEPLNDYDIVIVVGSRAGLSRIKELSREVAEKVGIRQVDLILLRLEDLPTLPYTMFNYDMKYGGYVFYGKEDILSRIPDYDFSKMPLIEGKNLLFNRMICLLESYTEEFGYREPDNEEKFFLVNQCGKVALACCDALLLLTKLYHHSYVEKSRRFAERFKGKGELVSLIQQATGFKLRPTMKIDFNVVDYWFDTKEKFVEILKNFLEIFYERKFKDWEEFSKFYRSDSIRFWRRIMTVIEKGDNSRAKTIIELSELFLLNGVGRYSFTDTYIDAARINLEKISDDRLLHSANWECLRKECVALWFKHLH